MTEEMLYPKDCFEQFRTNHEITLGVYSIVEDLEMTAGLCLRVDKLVLSMLLLPEVSTMCMILSRRPIY